MKEAIKVLLFFLCIIVLFSVFTCAYANNFSDIILDQNTSIFFQQQQNEEETKQQTPSFKLPASLITIEESAFEGTALNKVELPENVKVIGDNAFAKIKTLKQINIPNSTIFIGKDTFKGSNQVIITAAPKSYARTYAQGNNIPFNPITSFYAFTPSPQITSLSNGRAEIQKLLVEGETTENPKSNQTGRMTGELNADRYENITAFHIQGRSPPMG